MNKQSLVWGPKYWFVLHSIARTYPIHPDDNDKKRYYEFIMNLPYFIPEKSIGKSFENVINEYPVSSYLDTRKSFMKWVHFIHNIINETLNKPKISYQDSLYLYNEYFHPENDLFDKRISKYIGIIGTLVIVGYLLYKY